MVKLNLIRINRVTRFVDLDAWAKLKTIPNPRLIFSLTDIMVHSIFAD